MPLRVENSELDGAIDKQHIEVQNPASSGHFKLVEIMQKSYEINCNLDLQTTIGRIQKLLTHEGVAYQSDGSRIHSIRTPWVFFNFQRVLYTRKNWVGLNPFIYVSGVDVFAKSKEMATTEVAIKINQFRTYLFTAFWLVAILSMLPAMPEPLGVILLVSGACVSWLGLTVFLGGYLIRKEIGDALKIEKD